VNRKIIQSKAGRISFAYGEKGSSENLDINTEIKAKVIIEKTSYFLLNSNCMSFKVI
jgi:hypothetical protein